MNLIGKEHYMALTKDQLIADIAEAIDAPKTTARNALDQLGQSLPISWKTAAKSPCQVSAS